MRGFGIRVLRERERGAPVPHDGVKSKDRER